MPPKTGDIALDPPVFGWNGLNYAPNKLLVPGKAAVSYGGLIVWFGDTKDIPAGRLPLTGVLVYLAESDFEDLKKRTTN